MKNYRAIYEDQGDASSLEQKWFIKEETIRGVLTAPGNSDYFLAQNGGSIEYTQTIESSEQKSGRHHKTPIEQRETTDWSFTTFCNIDLSAIDGQSSIDRAIRTLYKNMFGSESVSGGVIAFDSTIAPQKTFSIFEIADIHSNQVFGAIPEAVNLNFPGDGQPMQEWSGFAKSALLVGIGKSTIDNTGGNTFELENGEGELFPVDAYVMIVGSDGVTRLDGTSNGPRQVEDRQGDTIILSGEPLAASDGSTNAIYLVYWEPENTKAIDNIQTGIGNGEITIAGIDPRAGELDNSIRSLSINCTNNHERIDYVYGKKGLGDTVFNAAGRLTCELTMEINLNRRLLHYIIGRRKFEGTDINIKLGDLSGRHLSVEIPRFIANVPTIPIPDTGSIPVSFTGNLYQSLIPGDEITIKFN